MQASPLVFDILRVLLVVVHLLAVGVAVGLVFWQDLALLRSRRLNALRFRLSAVRVTRALMVLWASGLAILALDTGFDPAKIAGLPRTQAKLLVVSLLTFNGWALHRIAFPALLGARTRAPSARTAAVVSVLGAVSSVSWVYAMFVGVARPLAQALGFAGFISVYLGLLLAALAVALVFVRPQVQTLMWRPAGFTKGQVMAIVCGLAQTERAGTLHRLRGLDSAVSQVATAPPDTGSRGIPPTETRR